MSYNNEEDKENLNKESVSDGQESTENEEELKVANSSNAKLEEKAIQVAEKTLGEPFNAFDPVSYLNEFYPNLDSEFALRVMDIIKENEQKEETKTVIDIRAIEEILKKDSIQLGEKSLESLENCAIMDFMLRKAVPEILKDKPEDHLNILDVGGGSTIYQHIPLMGIADSITHCEYLESNREEVKLWQEGKSLFDWQSFFSVFKSYLNIHPELAGDASKEVQDRFEEMASLETNILEDKLREKITQILPVDVFREDLGMGEDEQNYDVVNIGREGSVELITSNFCIESATADFSVWQRGIENVTSKVSKDGFLLMTAIRNAKWYKVGDEKMPAVVVDAEILSDELKKHGFEIRCISEVVGSEQEIVGYDGMVFVLAKRVMS